MLEATPAQGTQSGAGSGDLGGSVLNIVAFALAVIGVLGAPPAPSRPIQLSIRDGRVWLKADHATITDVLAEWARVGHTQIVNAESLAAIPLTVELRDVPELEALAVITRSTGGFMTVSRAAGNADAAATLSQFSRVVILAAAPRSAFAKPATTPAAADPPPADSAAVYTVSGAQRIIGADGQLVPDDQEDSPPAPPLAVPAVPHGGSFPPGFSEPPDVRSPGRTPAPGVITPPATPPRRPTSG